VEEEEQGDLLEGEPSEMLAEAVIDPGEVARELAEAVGIDGVGRGRGDVHVGSS
jgi:hypothetical protein